MSSESFAVVRSGGSTGATAFSRAASNAPDVDRHGLPVQRRRGDDFEGWLLQHRYAQLARWETDNADEVSSEQSFAMAAEVLDSQD
ncbi:MAG TPA: hypothetical protein VN636_15850 [Acidimicrobiia bacterium]|nr:hypothetical protein [Acidimicrobiia bacterium]